MIKKIKKIAKQMQKQIKSTPQIAIILGSGLADFVNSMEEKIEIPYSSLKGMPQSKVKGHKNQFVIGKIYGKTIIAMQGRFHPYDGFTAKECALPIYLFKLLGVSTLILTNSSGAINESYNAGDIMLIKSHINLTGMNPLIDGAIMDFGEQFIDLKDCYNKEYIKLAQTIAKENNIELKVGVYAQNLGPTYETPAEVIMLRNIGVDAVAMSTVLESIAGCQCKMKIIGFSCISNKAVNYEDDKKLTHEEVLQTSIETTKKLKLIIPELIKRMD